MNAPMSETGRDTLRLHETKKRTVLRGHNSHHIPKIANK